jgi:hypothetical protein
VGGRAACCRRRCGFVRWCSARAGGGRAQRQQWALPRRQVLAGGAAMAPPEAGAATEVDVTYKLYGISRVSTRDEQFECNLKVRCTWPARAGLSEVELKLRNGASGEVEMVGKAKASENNVQQANIRVSCPMRITRLSLGSFPFDEQLLEVQLQSKQHVDKVRWKKASDDGGAGGAGSSYADELHLSEWRLTGQSMRIHETDPLDSLASKSFSACTITFTVQRRPWYYVANIFSVVFLITTSSFATSRLAVSEVASRLQIAQTAFLSLIAFRFATADAMPKSGTNTTLDVYFFASYFFVFVQIAFIWLEGGAGGLAELVGAVDEALVDKVFFICCALAWAVFNLVFAAAAAGGACTRACSTASKQRQQDRSKTTIMVADDP